MKIVVAVIAALSLTACATAQLDSGKTLTEANNLISDAAGQFHNAYVLGLVTKDQAKTEASWVDAASVYSRNAQCAWTAGDWTTVNGAVQSITAYAAAIVAEQTGKPVPTLPTLPPALTCANPAPVSAVVTH